MFEKNIIKNADHLRKVADEEVSKIIDNDKMDIEFSEKIFLHNDEEKRVTYDHIRSFYMKAKQEKFNRTDFIYYFGHALKGKGEEIYNMPISRNIDDVKKEVFKKMDLKALGAHQGRKIKIVKKMIEEKYINNFQKTHFGIAPLTPARFQEICG